MFRSILAELLNFIIQPLIGESVPDSMARMLSAADSTMLTGTSASPLNPLLQSVIVAAVAVTVYFLLRHVLRISEKKALPRTIDRQPLLNLAIMVLALFVYYTITVTIYHLPSRVHLAVIATALVILLIAAHQQLFNIISGFLLIISRPFRVGDWITVEGYTGRVVRRYLGNTVLSLESGALWYVPNRLFHQQPFRNLSAGRRIYPVTFELRIPRDLDLVETRRKAREVALASPYVYLDERVEIYYRPAPDDHIFLIVQAFVIEQNYASVFETNLTEILVPLLTS